MDRHAPKGTPVSRAQLFELMRAGVSADGELARLLNTNKKTISSVKSRLRKVGVMRSDDSLDLEAYARWVAQDRRHRGLIDKGGVLGDTPRPADPFQASTPPPQGFAGVTSTPPSAGKGISRTLRVGEERVALFQAEAQKLGVGLREALDAALWMWVEWRRR